MKKRHVTYELVVDPNTAPLEWEHKEFIREANGPPRDSAYSRGWHCAERNASVPIIQPSEPIGRIQTRAGRMK